MQRACWGVVLVAGTCGLVAAVATAAASEAVLTLSGGRPLSSSGMTIANVAEQRRAVTLTLDVRHVGAEAV